MQHSQPAVFTRHAYRLAAVRRGQDNPVIPAFKGHLLTGELFDHALQRSNSIGQCTGVPVSEGFIRQRADHCHFGQLLRVQRKRCILIFQQYNRLLSRLQ
ncbi:hypothetical protein D3C80_1769880 [compost metagenome]